MIESGGNINPKRERHGLFRRRDGVGQRQDKAEVKGGSLDLNASGIANLKGATVNIN